MLYIGEKVGTGKGPAVDIALDPLEGTTLTAKDMPNALTVIAMAPRGTLLHAPDVYMEKLAIGPGYAIDTVTLKMSPAERQSPAVVRDFSALPGKAQLFATEAEGGNRLVKIGQSFFDHKSPRPTIQFIVVSLRWNEKDPVKAELIRQFKQNFDFKALQQMLGK